MGIEEEATVAIKVWDTIKNAKWRSIGKLTFLVVLAFCAVAYWENRQEVYVSVNTSLGRMGKDAIPNDISERSKADIKSAVDRSPTIVAASLVNIDFRKNTKTPVYFYADNASVTNAVNDYTKVMFQAELFQSNNEEANDRMVRIIAGEFVCVPVPHHFVQNVPAIGKVATTVCSISVPPYFGQIVGYLNIWIDHPPRTDEIPELRVIARTMSISVYERDIK